MGISQGEDSERQRHFQHLLSSPQRPDTKPIQSRRNLSIICLTYHCNDTPWRYKTGNRLLAFLCEPEVRHPQVHTLPFNVHFFQVA